MQKYEMVERGQSNIKITSNATGGLLTIYKLKDNVNNGIDLTDITETFPTINTIAGGMFEQYILTAPNEDCYLLILLNGEPMMLRVGNPIIRALVYTGVTGMSISYTLYNFDGTENTLGVLTEAGNGIYFMTPSSTGDFILACDNMPPRPIHTPYLVDYASMSGSILFAKDQWMMVTVPVEGMKISDVVSAIESKYGVAANTLFRVFSAYPSTDTQSKEMLDFVPGVTPIGSKYNFDLVMTDNGVKEIVPFWVKTLNYQLTDDNGNAIPDLVRYDWNA